MHHSWFGLVTRETALSMAWSVFSSYADWSSRHGSRCSSKCFEADVRQLLSVSLISSRSKRGTQVCRIVGDPFVEQFLFSEKGSIRRFGLLKVAALGEVVENWADGSKGDFRKFSDFPIWGAG